MGSSSPLVSVVTPVYNCSAYLGQTVESALAQSYTNWELLLVDDGSTDGSAEIAASFASRYPSRVTCAHHPGRRNRGVSATRNLGLHRARGAYVALLDSDDVWLPGKLEQQVAALEAHPEAGLAYCPVLHIDTAGALLPTPPFGEGEAGHPVSCFSRLLRGNFIPACSVLLRRACLAEGLQFEERLRYQFEDWLLWTRLAHRVPFLFLPRPLAHYRIHGASFMQGMNRYKHAEATAEWVRHLFRGEFRGSPHRAPTCRYWSRRLLWWAHLYAEQGDSSHSLRILLLALTLDLSVLGCRMFHSGWLKTILGRRGTAALQALLSRQPAREAGA